MKTVKIIQLTNDAPSTSMSPGAGSTDGTRLVIMKNQEGFWYCFDGSSGGNWFESDDQGPFSTREQAIEAGRADYKT